MSLKSKAVLVSVTAVASLGFAAAASANTLETVKQRGSVVCGVSDGLPGFFIAR